jgi:hypothetical protein
MKNSCNKLSEFTTDGCSGGMSLLWNNLLGKLPFLPDRLPWEQDCINHDHAYHIGGSKADRLYADRRLAAAVTIYPNKVRPDLRNRIILFQNECDEALWNYWTQGAAANPRFALPVVRISFTWVRFYSISSLQSGLRSVTNGFFVSDTCHPLDVYSL